MKPEIENTEKSQAQILLERVKDREVKAGRTYELRITPTLAIMVTKENFNREYAEAYLKRIEGYRRCSNSKRNNM